MAYKSILLNLNIDGDANSLINFAADLAKRFDARLIGLSAADVPPPTATTEGVVFDGEIMVRQRDNIERRLVELRKEFEGIAGAAVETEWRGAVTNPTRLLIDTAGSADLIVAASSAGDFMGNAHRCVDLGNLVLHAGRPILIASRGDQHVQMNKILVAWTETREARRAVSDAIPLLSLAKEVRIITVDSAASDATWKSLHDVTAFLSRHGIKAEADVFPEKAEGWTVVDLANAMHADLIVSGAYGHSRLREWVFGGVTRSLHEEGGLHRFMSN